jgi:hypothetical protein
MFMPDTPSPDNYTLGRGIVYFSKKTATGYDGERDLGNAPEFTFSVALDTLDHFSSRSGLKAKDKKVVTLLTPGISFVLDEVNADNLALLTLTDSEEINQAVSAADSGENEAIVGVNPDRFYVLGKRNTKITTLKYDTGTVIFVKGLVVTGAGGAQAKILEVDGDVVSGTLYLGVVTGGPFIDGEALTDSGTGAALADGVDATADGIALTDGEAAPVFYTAGTDFSVDATRGRIKILKGGAIVAADDLEALYHYAVASYTKIKAFSETEIEGLLRFIGDCPVGSNAELEIWRVSLTPSGDTALIGDDWSTISFDGEVLKDEAGHPESPYMNVLLS